MQKSLVTYKSDSYLSETISQNVEHYLQALCSAPRVPARRVAPVAPMLGHFGRCGILESSESWILYDSLRMIVHMTGATVHMTVAYNSNIEENIRMTRGPTFHITQYLHQRLLAIGVRPTNKGLAVTLVRERA